MEVFICIHRQLIYLASTISTTKRGGEVSHREMWEFFASFAGNFRTAFRKWFIVAGACVNYQTPKERFTCHDRTPSALFHS